ncbi:carotenoid oxygenase family protein [Geobacter sp. DSM 9736]|uniref:carotenoid oxygenase family protein n=1 Tax=Geobacter sp. DSM 9736 TaxID=1277350 RepID=UPI000B60310D|nr:carotenoid oxygenase family protein [Geobacter sp. DSM 9736]SNB47652.1 all-trans-8'-apo-beta-carotenal 15,15'-oxygenase [Geobacter sp. DSM 9736]
MMTFASLSRRQFLAACCASGLSLALPGCARDLPLRKEDFPDFGDSNRPYLGMATSLRREFDYEASVEGRIPPSLRGTLYRNGPGLFDRGGLRKRTLIDGDGMVQSFCFDDRGVRYRNRFVRTPKFIEEEAAGCFTRPTWSTQAPGGWLANIWRAGDVISQAGISVVFWRGKLFAFDESSLPFEIDPETLATVGETSFGLPRDLTTYSGHPKLDPATGEWLHFGVRHGPSPEIHLTAFGSDGRLTGHRSFPLPRYVYMHDWFVTRRHAIINLHPLEISVWGFLLGRRSLADSLRWQPQKGTLLMVIDRHSESPPLLLETEARFMWHSINAVERGNEIVADFVGYRNPDHIVGSDPFIFAAMEGRPGEHRWPGEIRRYRIDLNRRKASQEITYAGRCEWPRINDRLLLAPYRYAYVAESRPGEFFWSGITRFDITSGRVEQFWFPAGVYCCEPNFVPLPGYRYSAEGAEPGWVLTEIYDSTTRTSSLAVLDAERTSAGPIATVCLTHHVPFSYHGWWRPAPQKPAL